MIQFLQECDLPDGSAGHSFCFTASPSDEKGEQNWQTATTISCDSRVQSDFLQRDDLIARLAPGFVNDSI
jgi:hypothetical protein